MASSGSVDRVWPQCPGLSCPAMKLSAPPRVDRSFRATAESARTDATAPSANVAMNVFMSSLLDVERTEIVVMWGRSVARKFSLWIVRHIVRRRVMQGIGVINPVAEAAIVREQIAHERRVRFFDDELTAKGHAVAKHSSG